ncbi:MAG: DUF1648 domain-containing protein [Conexivisphaerales archaeon]
MKDKVVSFLKQLSFFEIATWLIIVLFVITSLYYYNRLPDKVATNFDMLGNPSSYKSKGDFLSDLYATFMTVLLLAEIGAKDEEAKNRRNVYSAAFVVLTMFFLINYLYLVLRNLGVQTFFVKIPYPILSWFEFGFVVFLVVLTFLIAIFMKVVQGEEV